MEITRSLWIYSVNDSYRQNDISLDMKLLKSIARDGVEVKTFSSMASLLPYEEKSLFCSAQF